MADHLLEQALYFGSAPGRYQVRARSPGFRDEWLAETERLCDGFGERPAGVACPACVFAQPLDKRHVAVVQVADQGDGGLGFHFLVFDRSFYVYGIGGNPFSAGEKCPPPWKETGPLEAIPWPDGGAAPARTLAEVQRILKRAEGPTFLGAAQALVDGFRIAFERTAPDTALLRDLWALVPTTTRAELWPASFAFGNALGFHVLIVPPAEREPFEGYLTEEQAGDYPEGRYELALQYAAEHNDQRELDQLFARRSRMETFRLGVLILLASLVVLLVLSFIKPPVGKAGPAPTKPQAGKGKP